MSSGERGQLEATPLPRVILDLHTRSFSGALKLVRGRVEKTFLFQRGAPITAESNLASETLGVQLMDTGALSREDYTEVVKFVEERRCKEGQAMLALQLLDPKALFLALKNQVRIRLVECFGWADGEFSLDPEQLPPDEAQPFRADVYALMQEGIETHWSVDRILADFGPKMGRYASRTASAARILPRLRWDSAVDDFADALDGNHTFWKALQAATSQRALAAAWVLDALDGLAFSDRACSDEEATPEDLPVIELVTPLEAAPEAEKPTPEELGAAAAGSPEDPAVRALVEEIGAKFARLDDLDHYELLGLDAATSAADIKRSYFEAAKTYHPDTLARAQVTGEVRARASRVFAQIGRAYSVLSNPIERREYDAHRGLEEAGIDADRIANAEQLYRKGEILLRQGNFKGALQFLQSAVDLWPDEADYQSDLGWALYKKMPSEPEAARTHLERAAELVGDDAVVLFRFGVVLRAVGEEAAGERVLARAKQIDRERGPA